MPPSSWYDKPNAPPKVKLADTEDSYTFLELFKLVENWTQEEQRYALENVFLPYLPLSLGKKISQNTNWKNRINPLKEKLGLA